MTYKYLYEKNVIHFFYLIINYMIFLDIINFKASFKSHDVEIK